MNKNAYYKYYKLTSMENILTPTTIQKIKGICSEVDGRKSGVHMHDVRLGTSRMAIEETSAIAATSNEARMARGRGGF